MVFTSGDTDLGEYQLTSPMVSGVDESVNSNAFQSTETATAEKANVPGIIMPLDKDIYTTPYVHRNVDAGIYKPSKEYSEDTESGADGAGVKVGDQIKYEMIVSNSDDNPQNIKIFDKMSKGLKLIPGSVKLVKV